jgi:hypothetical protein
MDNETLVERSLYEQLRLKVVAGGYTPNIASFADTPAGWAAYKTALSTIKTTKGFAIEVFGFSPPDDKGAIQSPRMVFYSDAFIPGTVGVQQTPIYTPNADGGYDSLTHDPLCYDLLFSCQIRASTTDQFRVLRRMLHEAFPPFVYIPVIGTSYHFLCILSGADTRDPSREGILEGIYRYYVPDILFSQKIVEEAEAALSEITINIQIANHLGISTLITNNT